MHCHRNASAFLIVPNLVRGLVPSAPDQIRVADITYVHLARAFVYLAVILDAFSRKAVGWPIACSGVTDPQHARPAVFCTHSTIHYSRRSALKKTHNAIEKS